ncbi:MAG: hypothetical protein CMB67_03250 [Euryarchaeota archaeon]|nr:hypothetical protein [Euryarchaeota archaeon]
MGDSRPTLLVAKGTFGAMGGAERDLIRVLPELNSIFDVRMATIQSSPELESACSGEGIPLIRPESDWELPTGAIATVMDTGRRTAYKAWGSCEGLQDAIRSADAAHLVCGEGSLPLLDYLPEAMRVHLLLHEPHRGLYEDTLHRRVDGSPKRSLALTRALLSRARANDRSLVSSLISREGSAVSGNSHFSAHRAKEVYGVDAGVIWPCLDTGEFPGDPSGDPDNPFPTEMGDYVVTIGRASWAKGTWETVSMLRGTGLCLAHVGGGDEVSVRKLGAHAQSCEVPLWEAPRLDSPDLVSLMRGSRAIVGMARGESFGLTPIEAFSLGVPAIFVDEGCFRDTIQDGVSGRLLGRNDIESWHSALEQASDPATREEWSENGMSRVEELDLSPGAQALRIRDLLQQD